MIRANKDDNYEIAMEIVASAVDGIITIESDGIVRSLNPAAEKMFGYLPDEVIGRNIKMLMPQRYAVEHDDYLANYLSTGERKIIGFGREVEATRKDGTTFPIHLSVSEVNIDGLRIFAGIIQDISRRRQLESTREDLIGQLKHANHRLNTSEAVNRGILDSTLDCIVLINQHGVILEFSGAVENTLGWKPEELIGQNLESTIIPPIHHDAHHKGMARFLREGSKRIIGNRVFVDAQRKDGTTISVELLVQAIQGENETLFAGFIRDMTEQNRREQQIKDLAADLSLRVEELATQSSELSSVHAALEVKAADLSRSNRELEQFASIASHDLQEPLRKVQMLADRLSSKYNNVLDETGKNYVSRMQVAAKRMRALVSDLLELAKVSGEGRPFVKCDLEKIIENVVSNLEVSIQESNATITAPRTANPPIIEADESQMRQLIQNLIANAIRYRRPGVPLEVTICADLSSGSQATGKAMAIGSSEWLAITVSDNGIGFEPLYAERIFRIFQRLHSNDEYEGTGMGLSICQRIIERHHGTIMAEGKPGEGAIFRVILPVRQARD